MDRQLNKELTALIVEFIKKVCTSSNNTGFSLAYLHGYILGKKGVSYSDGVLINILLDIDLLVTPGNDGTWYINSGAMKIIDLLS